MRAPPAGRAWRCADGHDVECDHVTARMCDGRGDARLVARLFTRLPPVAMSGSRRRLRSFK